MHKAQYKKFHAHILALSPLYMFIGTLGVISSKYNKVVNVMEVGSKDD